MGNGKILKKYLIYKKSYPPGSFFYYWILLFCVTITGIKTTNFEADL